DAIELKARRNILLVDGITDVRAKSSLYSNNSFLSNKTSAIEVTPNDNVLNELFALSAHSTISHISHQDSSATKCQIFI
ncbi:unnamed protein product, partial [Rotaria magnacalcarata]